LLENDELEVSHKIPPLKGDSLIGSRDGSVERKCRRCNINKELKKMMHLLKFYGCPNILVFEISSFFKTREEYLYGDYLGHIPSNVKKG